MIHKTTEQRLSALETRVDKLERNQEKLLSKIEETHALTKAAIELLKSIQNGKQNNDNYSN